MFQYISPDQGDNTLRLQVGSKRAVSIDFSETLYLNLPGENRHDLFRVSSGRHLSAAYRRQ